MGKRGEVNRVQWDDSVAATKVPNGNGWHITKPKTLIPQGNGHFVFGDTGIVLSDLGADFSSVETVNQDDIETLAGILLAMNERIQLWIGDVLNIFKQKFEVTYDEFALQYDLQKGTLYNYAYVADKIPISLRSEVLSYSHYQIIAAQDEDRREYWIDVAEFGDPVCDRNGAQEYESDGITPKRKPLSVAKLRQKILEEDNKPDDGKDKYKYLTTEEKWNRAHHSSPSICPEDSGHTCPN